MKNLYGIWIDHKLAQIVKANLAGDSFTITSVESDVEGHAKESDEGGDHFTIVNQHKQESRRGEQMKHFGEEVISHIQDAEEIVIFGPGEAKHEFKHILEKHKALAGKLKSVETTDRLTEAELREFTKKVFMLPR